jgi:hypothetical protein
MVQKGAHEGAHERANHWFAQPGNRGEARGARGGQEREREREKAAKAEAAAERRRQKEAEKQAATAAKSLQLSQRGKRPASKPPAQGNKRVKRGGGVASDEVGGGAAPLPPPKTTRRGRNVNLLSKYKKYKLIASVYLLLHQKIS